MAEQAEPERSADGRYLIINGQRWRAGAPDIPDGLRVELVAELMAARRLVKTEGDAVRGRVHDAKVALGERGRPWWEPRPDARDDPRVPAVIRTLLRHRDGTICPSDVARVIGGAEWRTAMDGVRAVAWALSRAQVVEIRRRGEPVTDPTATGPIRIARGPAFDSGSGRAPAG